MKNWQQYWKSILAFLVLVATNAATDLMQSGNPWPSNSGEWVRWGVSIVGGTLLVYAKRNADPIDKSAPVGSTDDAETAFKKAGKESGTDFIEDFAKRRRPVI